MRVLAVITTLLSAVATASAFGVEASLAETARTYDTAVVCKAFSLLATNVLDDGSKAAVAAIDAEIARDSAESGRTAEQAKADVEYSRYDWEDTKPGQAFFDNEWTKCLSIWSK